MKVKDFWQQIKNNLQKKNSHNEVILEWFKPIELIEIKEDSDVHRFHLGVPSPLHKYWISKNLNSLLDSISSEISANYNKPFQLELVVMEGIKILPKNNEKYRKQYPPLRLYPLFPEKIKPETVLSTQIIPSPPLLLVLIMNLPMQLLLALQKSLELTATTLYLSMDLRGWGKPTFYML